MLYRIKTMLVRSGTGVILPGGAFQWVRSFAEAVNLLI